MKRLVFLPLLALLGVSCYKPLNLEKYPVPPGTLVLEFAGSLEYVVQLKIDGDTVPIKFSGKNRVLYVEGLTPGEHDFTIHSISYVFGPEHEKFQINRIKGAYFFIQLRKYRSALPKNKAQVSMRANRKKLKKEGVDVNAPTQKIRAYFK